MRKTVAVVIGILIGVGASSAQFRSQIPQETRVGATINDQVTPSFLFGWFNPEKFQMHHSFGMSYMTFGGEGISLGTYTNTMTYQFAQNLQARADVTLSYSPYNTFANKFGSTPAGLNGIHLSRAEVNYRPWENVYVQLQYRQLPLTGYYSPFYDPWDRAFGSY